MRGILDAQYEKLDLNKVMSKRCQHLNTEERERLLHLLQKYEDLFDSTLGTWNITPAGFLVKGLCKASVLATLSSNQGTRSYVYKIG